MKHFVIEIIYLAPIEKVNEARERHRAYITQGYTKGWFLMSGPKEPRTGGFIIARAENKEELVNFLKDDPYQKENIAEYKFTEFAPFHSQDIIKEWL